MSGAADPAVRVIVSAEWAEVVGAVLMDSLGPYAEEAAGPGAGSCKVALIFYPGKGAPLTDPELLSLLSDQVVTQADITIEHLKVPRDWVDGWKDHFHPVTVGRVRVRPPWEPPTDDEALTDIVINPGLGFGTGLHPTTRGTLALLQADPTGPGDSDAGSATSKASTASAAPAAGGGRGALVDSGTGSGILAIAAAKLGWGPVMAFDNDPVALVSARENVTENRVSDLVEVVECDLDEAPLEWFKGATVLANMTLLPVLALLRRVTELGPSCLVVSGILAGAQEETVLREAEVSGLVPRRRWYEAEWASVELAPADHRPEES